MQVSRETRHMAIKNDLGIKAFKMTFKVEDAKSILTTDWKHCTVEGKFNKLNYRVNAKSINYSLTCQKQDP